MCSDVALKVLQKWHKNNKNISLSVNLSKVKIVPNLSSQNLRDMISKLTSVQITENIHPLELVNEGTFSGLN